MSHLSNVRKKKGTRVHQYHVIPNDWDGEKRCILTVCVPDSPQWQARIRGLFLDLGYGRSWNGDTGSIKGVLEIAQQIYDSISMTCIADLKEIEEKKVHLMEELIRALLLLHSDVAQVQVDFDLKKRSISEQFGDKVSGNAVYTANSPFWLPASWSQDSMGLVRGIFYLFSQKNFDFFPDLSDLTSYTVYEMVKNNLETLNETNLPALRTSHDRLKDMLESALHVTQDFDFFYEGRINISTILATAFTNYKDLYGAGLFGLIQDYASNSERLKQLLEFLGYDTDPDGDGADVITA